MMRRIRTGAVLLAGAALLALAGGEPVLRSQAQAPAPRRPVVERWDTYPADSVERQRVVGRLMLTLRPGMTRQQVEDIVGPADDPRETEYSIGENLRILGKYYVCRPSNLPEPERSGFYAVGVAYDVTGPVPVLLCVGYDTYTGVKRLIGPEELFP